MLASLRAAFGAGTDVQSSGPLCAVRIGVSRMLSVLYLLLFIIVVPYVKEKERDKTNLRYMVNGSLSGIHLVYQFVITLQQHSQVYPAQQSAFLSKAHRRVL